MGIADKAIKQKDLLQPHYFRKLQALRLDRGQVSAIVELTEDDSTLKKVEGIFKGLSKITEELSKQVELLLAVQTQLRKDGREKVTYFFNQKNEPTYSQLHIAALALSNHQAVIKR
jgi:hypothetical protein